MAWQDYLRGILLRFQVSGTKKYYGSETKDTDGDA